MAQAKGTSRIMAIALSQILERELAETKHYGVYQAGYYQEKRPEIYCKCGYHLCDIKHDSVHYRNRRGNAVLYAGDPHFFDKLKKLLNELHRREVYSRSAFGRRQDQT
jgi:hypothetical protein